MKGFTRLVLMCFGVAGLLFSCTNPLKEERRSILPADSIISEQVMVELIADIHILEAGLLQKRNHGEKTAGLAEEWYRGLFAKYGITDSRFRQNLRYYQWDTEQYSVLYEKVIAEIRSRKNWLPSAPAVPKQPVED